MVLGSQCNGIGWGRGRGTFFIQKNYGMNLCKHSHALMLSYLIGYDYTHSTVNHSEHFKDPLTGTHTNTIEGRYWYLCVGIEFDPFCDFSRWFCVKRLLPRSGNYDLESYVSFWIFLLSFYFKVLARVYVAAKSGAPGWRSFWRILEDNCCQAESRWSWIRFARGLKIIKVLFLQWFQNWNYFLFSSTMSCPVHNITVFTVERRWLQVNRIAVTFKKIVLKGGRWHVHVFSVVFSFLLKIVWEFMCRDGALKSVSDISV